MRIVVIGGQARKIGKTSVMTGLIRGLRRLNWAAVKISTHEVGIPHWSDAEAIRAGPDRGFILTEETRASTITDTGRFLTAGARRAFWLRVKSDCLIPALAVLFRALADEPNVIIESGSAMGALSPRIGIFVLDRSRREMKTNALRALAQADAVVEIDSGKRASPRFPRLPSGIGKFTVSRKDYSNPKLIRFVLLELQRLADSRIIPSGEVADQERNPYASTQRH